MRLFVVVCTSRLDLFPPRGIMSTRGTTGWGAAGGGGGGGGGVGGGAASKHFEVVQQFRGLYRGGAVQLAPKKVGVAHTPKESASHATHRNARRSARHTPRIAAWAVLGDAPRPARDRARDIDRHTLCDSQRRIHLIR